MDYLVIKLGYWVLASLAIGFVTGWLSCGPRIDKT